MPMKEYLLSTQDLCLNVKLSPLESNEAIWYKYRNQFSVSLCQGTLGLGLLLLNSMDRQASLSCPCRRLWMTSTVLQKASDWHWDLNALISDLHLCTGIILQTLLMLFPMPEQNPALRLLCCGIMLWLYKENLSSIQFFFLFLPFQWGETAIHRLQFQEKKVITKITVIGAFSCTSKDILSFNILAEMSDFFRKCPLPPSLVFF